VLVTGLALVLSLSGCEGLFGDVLLSTQGVVINVKNGEPISGASVTLTNVSDASKSYSFPTDTTGYYYPSVPSGDYIITAVKADHAFTKIRAQVSGIFSSLPQIGGFAAGKDDDFGAITLVTFWDPEYKDVDTYLSYPVNGTGGLYLPTGSMTVGTGYSRFYYPDSFGTAEFRVHPDEGDTNRKDIYFIDKTVSDGDFVLAKLDVDNRGASTEQAGGPETLSIFYAPLAEHTYGGIGGAVYTATTDDPSKLPAGAYKWIATFDYKVNAFHKTSSTATTPDGSSLVTASGTGGANPVTYVFSGTNLLGKFTTSEFIDIKHASMVRINYFMKDDGTEWFQILPNEKALTPRGIGDEVVNQIVVAPAPKR
jgi:hypothetical protein